jgi:hypothetical protein
MQSEVPENFDDMWNASDAQIDAFITLSRQTMFVCSVGLPGHVWTSGRPTQLDC